MKTDNNKISSRQSLIMMVLYILGFSATMTPVICISGAGQAGFISAFLVMVFILLPLFMVYFLLKNDKCASFYDLCRKTTGKTVTSIIYFLIGLKSIILAFLILMLFSQTIKIFLLPKTPIWETSIVMLLISCYLASKGMEARGRMGEIMIFLILLPFFLVFAAASFSVDINNISASLSVESADIFKTSLISAFSFCSFDFLLLHLHYCAERKQSLKKMFFGVLLSCAISAAAILITTACFGQYIMSKQVAPIPEIMNVIKLPATLIERHDLLNMFFWILLLFWLISTIIFFGCTAMKDLFKKPTHTVCIMIMFPFIFFLSLIPLEITDIYKAVGTLNIISNIITALIIIFIFIMKSKKKGEI